MSGIRAIPYLPAVTITSIACASTGSIIPDVPPLLIFVLHNKSGQAALLAALQERDEEDHGEESAVINLVRCLKNSEEDKKRVKL
jgi:hypothetical protein